VGGYAVDLELPGPGRTADLRELGEVCFAVRTDEGSASAASSLARNPTYRLLS
jgi:hypothetical protein